MSYGCSCLSVSTGGEADPAGRMAHKPAPVSISKATFLLRCPACGRGSLFRKFLTIHDTCPSCAFNLKQHDSADGPAYVSMFVILVLIVPLVFIIERAYEPPIWLHMLIWIPAIIIGSLICLLFSKAFFIAAQYRHNVHGFRDKEKS